MNGLRFLSSAAEFAKQSPFLRPDEVHRVFEALDGCASERQSASLGRSVQEWLKEKGIDYTPHESPATMGKYGKKRQFFDKRQGCRVEMQEHIKVGDGADGNKKLRIHIHWQEDEKKWLTGYMWSTFANGKRVISSGAKR